MTLIRREVFAVPAPRFLFVANSPDFRAARGGIRGNRAAPHRNDTLALAQGYLGIECLRLAATLIKRGRDL